MKKVLAVVLALLAVGGYVFMNQYKKSGIEEQLAASVVYEDAIKGKALFIRNETTFDVESAHVYSYVDDEERVANKEKILALYTTQQERSTIERISQLEKEIAETSVPMTSVDTDNAAAVEAELNKKAKEASKLIYQKDVEALITLKKEIETLKAPARDALGADEAVKTLAAERDSLKKQIASSCKEVYSSMSGVFVSFTDGMEATLTPDQYSLLTPSKVDEYIDNGGKTKNTSQYKIVDNYKWYAAMAVDAESVKELKAGKTVNLRFPELSLNTMEATIVSVSPEADGRVVVVCSTNYATSGIFTCRSAEVELIKKTYRGIRVDNSAIRIVDDKKGVFVNNGGIVKFKEVTVLINNEEVAIIKNEGTKNSLMYNDKVILSGRDIYDGKLLD